MNLLLRMLLDSLLKAFLKIRLLRFFLKKGFRRMSSIMRLMLSLELLPQVLQKDWNSPPLNLWRHKSQSLPRRAFCLPLRLRWLALLVDFCPPQEQQRQLGHKLFKCRAQPSQARLSQRGQPLRPPGFLRLHKPFQSKAGLLLLAHKQPPRLLPL
jgi:hypothetical protein